MSLGQAVILINEFQPSGATVDTLDAKLEASAADWLPEIALHLLAHSYALPRWRNIRLSCASYRLHIPLK